MRAMWWGNSSRTVSTEGGVSLTIEEISETEVTIDTNHRFAGQALTFDIELVTINE